VARAGIIDRDPSGAGKTGTQHIARLVEKAVLVGNQQAHDLQLGDDDAERSQQGEEPRHRQLSAINSDGENLRCLFITQRRTFSVFGSRGGAPELSLLEIAERVQHPKSNFPSARLHFPSI
jgi:hypothetical protein